MSRDQRVRSRGVVATEYVQVRAADATTVDLNNEVVGAGRGILDELHSGIVGSGNDHCAHHDPFSKG